MVMPPLRTALGFIKRKTSDEVHGLMHGFKWFGNEEDKIAAYFLDPEHFSEYDLDCPQHLQVLAMVLERLSPSRNEMAYRMAEWLYTEKCWRNGDLRYVGLCSYKKNDKLFFRILVGGPTER